MPLEAVVEYTLPDQSPPPAYSPAPPAPAALGTFDFQGDPGVVEYTTLQGPSRDVQAPELKHAALVGRIHYQQNQIPAHRDMQEAAWTGRSFFRHPCRLADGAEDEAGAFPFKDQATMATWTFLKRQAKC